MGPSDINQRYFPGDLLLAPIEERLAWFDNQTFKHPKLMRTLEEIKRIINKVTEKKSSKNSIVFIVGPTGVGKTTLIKKLLEQIWEEEAKVLEEDKAYIPIAYTEIIPPDNGKFSFKEYYIRVLMSLKEPLIDKKVLIDPSERYVSERDGVAPLRRALESALIYRKPKAIILDEAQHLLKAASGRKALDNLDVLKSLTNHTGTVHILVGTYELNVPRVLSAQTVRRGKDIHFSRYHKNIKKERDQFLKIIKDLQRNVPVEKEPDFLSMWEFLYDRSVGCVGILKDWIFDALDLALRENADTITFEHLRTTVLSHDKCEVILEEAENGERSFQKPEIEAKENQELLKYLQKAEQKEEQKEAKKATEEKVKKPKRRPGERAPNRDPVGVNALEEIK